MFGLKLLCGGIIRMTISAPEMESEEKSDASGLLLFFLLLLLHSAFLCRPRQPASHSSNTHSFTQVSLKCGLVTGTEGVWDLGVIYVLSTKIFGCDLSVGLPVGTENKINCFTLQFYFDVPTLYSFCKF